MTENGNWERLWELFHQIVEAGEEERETWLERADPDLRLEIESLLEAHEAVAASESGDAFLASPALDSRTSDLGVDPRIGRRMGKYRVLEALGEGGMGTVYAAEQEGPLRRRVALKVIRPGLEAKLDPREVLGRFDAERRALALLQHPNVATIHDAGSAEDGRPFFAMEFVGGPPIDVYCREHRLGVEECVRLLAWACRGVAHAHRRGIVHRDLKPANILVATIDGEPVPKVIDFGIAKATGLPLATEAPQTEHGRRLGTPGYMSPEQFDPNGTSTDPRIDVYALGVIVERLIAVAPNEPGSKPADMDLRRSIERATGRDPARRQHDAGELASELERWLGRGSPAPRRMPLVAAFGTSAAVALVAAFIGWPFAGSSGPAPRAASSPTAPSAALAEEGPRRIAVTFDDVPHPLASVPLVEVQAITGELLAKLGAHGVRATGFVNEGEIFHPPGEEEARTAILERWLEAGMDLGTHTYSHLSLDRVPLAEYQADVLRGDVVTRRLLAERARVPRYFRPPYLSTGRDEATRLALESFLAEHGYRVAPVTIETSDWYFSDTYRNLLASGDEDGARRFADVYLDFTAAAFNFFEDVSQKLFGRQVAHVWLLHVNRLNADVFERLAALVEARGYEFVSLDEALEDPAYERPAINTGEASGPWLYRWSKGTDVRIDWQREPESVDWVGAD